MAAIRLDGLTKRYGSGTDTVLAVKDLDLSIETGEIFGFLGPNGAGKSTTIDMLLGFIKPTAGDIEILGTDIRSNGTATRNRIGFLPDGYDVFHRLTAREHLAWVIEIRNASDDTEALLEQIGLTHAADRKAGTYSKGMQQRLALGMALVGNPDILILDEPSTGLDPQGMQEMRDILHEKAAEGVTVFFSSHILSEVEAVCDRVGILNNGELIIVDTIENLRAAADATIQLTLDTIPDPLGLEEVAGVTTVEVKDKTVSNSCKHAGVKVDVVRHVDERTTIQDILSEDTSLAEMFAKYTADGEPAGDSGVSEVVE